MKLQPTKNTSTNHVYKYYISKFVIQAPIGSWGEHVSVNIHHLQLTQGYKQRAERCAHDVQCGDPQHTQPTQLRKRKQPLVRDALAEVKVQLAHALRVRCDVHDASVGHARAVGDVEVGEMRGDVDQLLGRERKGEGETC